MEILLGKKQADLASLSIVADVGQSASTCGYCHSKERTSHTYGLWAFKLTCEDYQRLLDRGWRRSGQYLYKPNLATSCCPQYTISLNVARFKFSKSYKQVVMRFNRHVAGENDIQNDQKAAFDARPALPACARRQLADAAAEACEVTSADSRGWEEVTEVQLRSKENIRKTELGVLKKGNSSKKPKPFAVSPKASEAAEGVPPTLRRMVELVYSADCATPEYSHRFRTELVKSEFDPETFALYCKYQIAVHKDRASELSKKRYCNFLVDSPLMSEPPFTPGHKVGFGSYHHRYYLDDRLIACGVLDILPRCVSSVYFIYDPDLASLALGKYSVIREIALAAKFGRYIAELQKYYMGFYIHNCQKMKYKAINNEPSDLLDPETHEWIPYSQCRGVLDRHGGKYVPLRRELDEESGFLGLMQDATQDGASETAPNAKAQNVSMEAAKGSYDVQDARLCHHGRAKDDEVDTTDEEYEGGDDDGNEGAKHRDFGRMPGALDPVDVTDDAFMSVLVLEGRTVMPALVSDRIMRSSNLRWRLKRYYAVVGEDLARRLLVELS